MGEKIIAQSSHLRKEVEMGRSLRRHQNSECKIIRRGGEALAMSWCGGGRRRAARA